MKRKISFVILVSFSCLMLVFAGKDTCADKFKTCTDSCANAESQCKARGVDLDTCRTHTKPCMAECDKAKKTCETKK